MEFILYTLHKSTGGTAGMVLIDKTMLPQTYSATSALQKVSNVPSGLIKMEHGMINLVQALSHLAGAKLPSPRPSLPEESPPGPVNKKGGMALLEVCRTPTDEVSDFPITAVYHHHPSWVSCQFGASGVQGRLGPEDPLEATEVAQVMIFTEQRH